MSDADSPRMFATRQKQPKKSQKNSNYSSSFSNSKRARTPSSMMRSNTPGARSQGTRVSKNSLYSSNNKGSFSAALSELEKEEEQETTWYEKLFKRAAQKAEERRERRKAKKAKRLQKRLEREKRKHTDDFDPGTDGFEFYRWNGNRLQAEIFVFIGTMVFVFLFCALSIFLYCFAFHNIDSATDGAGNAQFNLTSSTFIPQVEHPWTVIDAIYFTVTSFLGNGFGDVVPTSAVTPHMLPLAFFFFFFKLQIIILSLFISIYFCILHFEVCITGCLSQSLLILFARSLSLSLTVSIYNMKKGGSYLCHRHHACFLDLYRCSSGSWTVGYGETTSKSKLSFAFPHTHIYINTVNILKPCTRLNIYVYVYNYFKR
jgi:hypothetical protein